MIYSQMIILYLLLLPTENTGLKDVDLKSKPKGCSGKINKLRSRSKNTTENSCIIQPGLRTEKPTLR